MIHFLTAHSVSIVGILALSLLLINMTKNYMKRKDLDRAQLMSLLRQKANEVGQFLLPKIAASVVLTLVISGVSFRELWVNDVYHVVFITSVLFDRVERYLVQLFE